MRRPLRCWSPGHVPGRGRETRGGESCPPSPHKLCLQRALLRGRGGDPGGAGRTATRTISGIRVGRRGDAPACPRAVYVVTLASCLSHIPAVGSMEGDCIADQVPACWPGPDTASVPTSTNGSRNFTPSHSYPDSRSSPPKPRVLQLGP